MNIAKELGDKAEECAKYYWFKGDCEPVYTDMDTIHLLKMFLLLNSGEVCPYTVNFINYTEYPRQKEVSQNFIIECASGDREFRLAGGRLLLDVDEVYEEYWRWLEDNESVIFELRNTL